jgi:uncharacterized protein (TIGR02145 family)
MKRNYLYGVILFILTWLIFITCKKEDNTSLSTVTTFPPFFISSTAATLGLNVESDGGSHIIDCGLYISISEDPETSGQRFQFGNDTGIFVGQLSGLLPSVSYYIKAFAKNGKGESLGNLVVAVTPGTIKDYDNNVYTTVKIDNQVWMNENLKTTSYMNGDPIGTTTPATADITGESEPKYQWAYDGNESNAAVYGRLYTGYAVTDSRGICPTGWHVPSNTELTTLINSLGGNDIAGGNLKESGTLHWDSPNNEATNISCFSALPGGGRYGSGNFSDIALGQYGWWWTSTTDNTTQISWILRYDNGNAGIMNSIKNEGFSVRCIKD